MAQTILAHKISRTSLSESSWLTQSKVHPVPITLNMHLTAIELWSNSNNVNDLMFTEVVGKEKRTSPP